MSQKLPKTYFPTLDGLRGIAILLVLLFHQMSMTPASWFDEIVQRVARAGWIGVDLFFVLSGFLITGILLRNKGTKGYFKTFYARRTVRIFPLYYAVLVFSFFILPRIEGLPERHFPNETAEQWWYWTYLSNILFTIRRDFRHSFLGPTWSLAIEEQFYLVWPFVVAFVPRRILKWLCAGLILTVFGVRLALSLDGTHWIPIYVLSPLRLDALVVGAGLAVLYQQYGTPRWLRRAATICCFVAGLAAIWLLYRNLLVHRAPFMQRYGYLTTALGFGGVLLTAIAAEQSSVRYRILTNGVLTTFGKYSYAIYLFNHAIYVLVKQYWFAPDSLPLIFGSRVPGQLVFSSVCILLSLAAAIVSWYVLEKPFLNLKRFVPYRGKVQAEGATEVPTPQVANA